MLGLYRKMHIPDDPLYFEKYYFTPGDLGWQVFATKAAKVGTLVCWDQWYPGGGPADGPARRGTDRLSDGDRLASGGEGGDSASSSESAWETAQRAHAIANGVFVAAVNRVGHEGPAGGGLEFWGGSFVCDPFGVVLANGSADRDELMIVGMRPPADRGGAAELAVSARPADRCLRRDHEANG